MNVVFVEPSFPPTQRHFARALSDVGATVIGIGERPADWLDDEVRGWLSDYHQVGNVTDVGVLTDVVRWLQSRLWVDRLETTIEAHTLPVAQVREACTIPGTSPRTACSAFRSATRSSQPGRGRASSRACGWTARA